MSWAKLRGGLNILFYTPVLVFFLFHKAGRQLKLRVIPCQLEDFKGHPMTRILTAKMPMTQAMETRMLSCVSSSGKACLWKTFMVVTR